MRDQQGSRLLVQHLSAQSKEALLNAALPRLVRLSCHEHASAVLLELLEGGDERLGVELAKQCQNAVLKLARDKFGCRILQRVLEVSNREVQRQLAIEIEGEVFACSRHMHANFVLQKCVQLLPASGVGFIVQGIEAHAVEAAQHQYSCRVLQRLIEHCTHEKLRTLLDNLLKEVPRLVKDTYGHNVIRAVLSYGEPDDQRVIIRYVRGHILQSARNRQSSLAALPNPPPQPASRSTRAEVGPEAATGSWPLSNGSPFVRHRPANMQLNRSQSLQGSTAKVQSLPVQELEKHLPNLLEHQVAGNKLEPNQTVSPGLPSQGGLGLERSSQRSKRAFKYRQMPEMKPMTPGLVSPQRMSSKESKRSDCTAQESTTIGNNTPRSEASQPVEKTGPTLPLQKRENIAWCAAFLH
eukprot:g3812.t1